MTTKFSYFPGCSLHSTAREYDLSARAVCAALGVELVELKDWNCCGATSAHATAPDTAHALGMSNLALAEKEKMDIVTPCSSCFSRLKACEMEAREDGCKGEEFKGEISARHLAEVLCDEVGPDRMSPLIRKPFKDLKAAVYYGCLMVRPFAALPGSDPENPTLMDGCLKLAGVTTVPWSYNTDCCGAGLSAPKPKVVESMTNRLAETAREAGAECFITACPLCQLNLDTRQTIANPLPVFFFTEILGWAMDLPGAAAWFPKHMISPQALLRG